MKSKSLAAVFLILAATVLPSQAILYNDGMTYGVSTGLAAAIALASDTTNFPMFAAVGQLNYAEGVSDYSATGTLISSEWVLTAAHNWNFGQVTAMTFTVGGTAYTADLTSLTQHPNWNNAPSPLSNASVGVSQGWDVALFRLTTPVPGITPAPLYTLTDEYGKTGYTVGFGRIGNGTSNSTVNTNDDKLAMANVIDRVTAQNANTYTGGALVSDFDSGAAPENTLSAAGFPDAGGQIMTLNPAGTITGNSSAVTQLTVGANVLEGGTAQGDSGGPTFILDGGTYKIAGITSWGNNPAQSFSTTGRYGDLTYMTRVSQEITWISTVVPEPATWALLGVAGILFFVRMRRRIC